MVCVISSSLQNGALGKCGCGKESVNYLLWREESPCPCCHVHVVYISTVMCFLPSSFAEERNDWMSILLNALKSQSPPQSQTVAAPDKCGYLELRGYKAKIFTVLSGNSVWLCKNEQVSCDTAIADCSSLITLATVLC